MKRHGVPSSRDGDDDAREERRAPRRDVGAAATPRFTTLDRSECEAVLARNTVGRIVYSFRDRVGIEPIHYVFADGCLYGRTSPGSKLETLRRSRWVSFEVDEVDGTFEWRSVVVRGAFYPLSPDGPELEARAWERAIDVLRSLIPETGTGADPVPFRMVVFRIFVDEISGRSATMNPDSDPRDERIGDAVE